MKEARYDYILNELKSNDRVTYEHVASKLNVSADTIRRDIDHLNKTGLLVKVRGGAISPSINPISFDQRAELFTEGKTIIALKAKQILRDVRTIFMDGGTTMHAIAANFPDDISLRVITHNTALIPILARKKFTEIVVLGGTYNRDTQTNLGRQTCQEAEQYQADLYFMGVCSIDMQIGITSAFREDGEVKRSMLKSSAKTVALGNQEKLHTADYFKVCDFNSVDALITDLRSDDSRLDPFRVSGVTII